MKGGHHLEEFLKPIFAQSNALIEKHETSHSTELMLMAVSVSLALGALLFGINKFKNYKKENELASSGIGEVLESKWYFDELYTKIITNPLRSLSAFFTNIVEKKGIDGMVNGTGKFVNYSGRQLRWLQSGHVGGYVLLMVIGMLVLFIVQLFIKN
jgi:NADH-quinone oxidoreductase subunit L